MAFAGSLECLERKRFPASNRHSSRTYAVLIAPSRGTSYLTAANVTSDRWLSSPCPNSWRAFANPAALSSISNSDTPCQYSSTQAKREPKNENHRKPRGIRLPRPFGRRKGPSPHCRQYPQASLPRPFWRRPRWKCLRRASAPLSRRALP